MPILYLPPSSYPREIVQIKSRVSSWPASYVYGERERAKLLPDSRVDNITQMVLAYGKTQWREQNW